MDVKPSIAAVVVLLLGSTTARAVAQQENRCEAPARRQLDFWIGRWTTTDEKGGAGGESVVEPVAGRCAVLERFSGPNGQFVGAGIHTVDPATGRWVQHWVDNRGVSLTMAGTFENGAMVYNWRAPIGPLTPQRYSVQPQTDGTVLQTGFVTKDGGKTWVKAWSLLYRKA